MVTREVIIPTIQAASLPHSSGVSKDSGTGDNVICAGHTEFIKRLCVGSGGNAAVIPPDLSTQLLLSFFNPSFHVHWNEELLALAQTLLDSGLPLSADQFKTVVAALESTLPRAPFSASLKFAAVVYSMVRKYGTPIRDGEHKASLAKVLGLYFGLPVAASVARVQQWLRCLMACF